MSWFERNRWTIFVAVLGIAAAVSVFLWMKKQQDELELDEENLLLKAELYAEKRAEEIASQRLAADAYLQKRRSETGVRHQVGTGGTENNLYAAHDWETNAEQMAPGVTTGQFSASLPVADEIPEGFGEPQLELDDETY